MNKKYRHIRSKNSNNNRNGMLFKGEFQTATKPFWTPSVHSVDVVGTPPVWGVRVRALLPMPCRE